MRNLVASAAVVFSLTVLPSLAMDPEEAGRQARQELKTLLDQQQSDRQAGSEQTADNAVPALPSKSADRRATQAIDSKVPTICDGC